MSTTEFERARKDGALALVPFMEAEWMRRRKHSPKTVKVNRALDNLANARMALDKAYEDLDRAMDAAKVAVDEISKSIEQEARDGLR